MAARTAAASAMSGTAGSAGTSTAASCGRASPNTTACATAGATASSASGHSGATLRPNEVISWCLRRPSMCRKPSASTWPRSPVRSASGPGVRCRDSRGSRVVDDDLAVVDPHARVRQRPADAAGSARARHVERDDRGALRQSVAFVGRNAGDRARGRSAPARPWRRRPRRSAAASARGAPASMTAVSADSICGSRITLSACQCSIAASATRGSKPVEPPTPTVAERRHAAGRTARPAGRRRRRCFRAAPRAAAARGGARCRRPAWPPPATWRPRAVGRRSGTRPSACPWCRM